MTMDSVLLNIIFCFHIGACNQSTPRLINKLKIPLTLPFGDLPQINIIQGLISYLGACNIHLHKKYNYEEKTKFVYHCSNDVQFTLYFHTRPPFWLLTSILHYATRFQPISLLHGTSVSSIGEWTVHSVVTASSVVHDNTMLPWDKDGGAPVQ